MRKEFSSSLTTDSTKNLDKSTDLNFITTSDIIIGSTESQPKESSEITSNSNYEISKSTSPNFSSELNTNSYKEKALLDSSTPTNEKMKEYSTEFISHSSEYIKDTSQLPTTDKDISTDTSIDSSTNILITSKETDFKESSEINQSTFPEITSSSSYINEKDEFNSQTTIDSSIENIENVTSEASMEFSSEIPKTSSEKIKYYSSEFFSHSSDIMTE